MLRIMHTADNHIGRSFSSYTDTDIQQRLKQERILALSRIVEEANSWRAHVIVVAGDLFDRVSVSSADIQRTVEVLRMFDGESVLVLPGNHDYCEGPQSELWAKFQAAARGTCIRSLLDDRRHRIDIENQAVWFYACPCPSKTSPNNRIGWVTEELKEPEAIHIGIAHGNVEGTGLDDNHRYFNMTTHELASAGLDTWLLGHIHAPFPAPGSVGKQTYFMPGIHTPDSVKSQHAGHAWKITIADDKSMTYEQFRSGNIRFYRRSFDLRNEIDINQLEVATQEVESQHAIMEFLITGRLQERELQQLSATIDRLKQKFLHLSADVNVEHTLDKDTIARTYPNGTLPYELLQLLMADEQHPGDAQLAFEILQEARS